MDTLNARLFSKIAIAALTVLLVFSAVFYLQRIIFSDASFILYNIINSGKFSIQEHRYGSFITQMFPLISSHAKLPLNIVIFLYSISFNLFFLFTALVLHRIRQYDFVLLLAFYFTACVTETFYWSNNEVHQGIAWMLLTFGFLFYAHEKNKKNLFILPLFTVLAFLALFSHPIIIIVSAAIFLYYFLEKKVFFWDRQTLIYLVIIIFLVAAKTYLSATGSYDKSKMGTLAHSIAIKNFIKVFGSSTAHDFVKSCIQDYWQFLLFFCSGIMFLLLQKRYKILAWTLVTVLVYFMCICIIYPESEYKFYIESEWMSISIFALLPFVRFVLPAINVKVAACLILAFFSMRLIQILNSSEKFTERLNEVKRITQVLQKNNIPKAIIENTGNNHKMLSTLTMSWGLPLETLIYSNIDRSKMPVTAILVPQSDVKNKLKESGTHDYINPFWNQWHTELNADYFHIDTSKPYVVLTDSLTLKTRE